MSPREADICRWVTLTDRVLGVGWEHLPAGTDINSLDRGLRASQR